MDSHLMKLGQNSLLKYNFQYLTAASLIDGGKSILAWFNDQFIHTAPLALNLVHNAAIHALYNPDYCIHVKNAPLDFLRVPNKQIDVSMSYFGYALTIAMAVVLSIVSASYVMFYVKVRMFDIVQHFAKLNEIKIYLQERECRVKFMQYVSGANLYIFWFTSILWDLLSSLITVVGIIILMALSQHEYWSDFDTLTIVFSVLVAFFCAMIPVVCLASLIFSKPTNALNILTGLGMTLGEYITNSFSIHFKVYFKIYECSVD